LKACESWYNHTSRSFRRMSVCCCRLVPEMSLSALDGDHVGTNPAIYLRERTALLQMMCRWRLSLIHDRKLS
jgi:hypothetical protein